ASVSISTTGGCVIGITKPLRFFPVSGDDPAVIGFYLCNSNKDSTFKRPKEQPDESAVVAAPRRSLKNRSGLIDSEHCLLHGEAALASTLFNVRGIMEFIAHRIADYVRA